MKGKGEEEALSLFPLNLLFIPLFPSRSNFLNELELGNAFETGQNKRI